MNKKFTFVVIALLGIHIAQAGIGKGGLGKFQLESIAKNSHKVKEKGEANEIAGALEWRGKLLADEQGEMKTEYYVNAVKRANQMRANHNQRSATLQWEELGPTNVGGRTLALLYDKRDANRLTLYAGAAGGGLWKSIDGGENWTRIASFKDNLAVGCIAQNSVGTIYIGTGEGFPYSGGTSRNSGTIGSGMYTLDASDNATLILGTSPAIVTDADNWSYINAIAINPTNDQDIYAATAGTNNKGGLQHSTDGGVTWTKVTSIVGLTTGYTGAGDVKFSSDGANAFAVISNGILGASTRLIASQDGGNTWVSINSTQLPNWPGAVARIALAVAPSNPMVAYICVSIGYGDFGGVWKTADAGGSWTKVGSKTGGLDPFGTNNQGYYDNAIAVNPFNEDQVFIGGTQLFSYTSLSGWSLASLYNGDPSNPYWIHPDIHAIVFNDKNKNEMFVCNDGGIFKTSNANSSFPNPTFRVKNRSYAVTQMYSVAADRYGSVIGGAQDNGTSFIDYANGGLRYATSIFSGDGVYCEISKLDPNVFIYGYVYGEIHRSNNRGTSYVDVFDAVIDKGGLGQPSICGQAKNQNSPFVSCFWLVESKNATNSAIKITYTNTSTSTMAAGTVVNLLSHTKQTFQESLPMALAPGQSYQFTDRIQSRLYFATACGLFMTPDVLDFTGTPRWFLINSSTDATEGFDASSTGDTIYLAGKSKVTRITGLNSLLYYDTVVKNRADTIFIPSANYSSTTVAGGRIIEGVGVDPNDPNHVICAVAGYSSNTTPHVYQSTDAGLTWTSAAGTGAGALPNMPLYNAIIDVYDPNHLMVSGDLGVWDSYDAGISWTEQNGGIDSRLPIYRLRQTPYLSDNCYSLYVGTHGRGLWRSTTLTTAHGCAVNALGINDPKNQTNLTDMLLYPNPMGATGKVMLELGKQSDVTLRIVDMPGRVLKEETIKNAKQGKNEYELDIANLSNGTYLVVVSMANGELLTRPLVVAK